MRHLLLLGACALTLVSQTGDFQKDFPVDKKLLGAKGSNPYFNLTPGYQLSFAHGKNTDTLMVLSETRTIDGVETRVVEDRELKNGQPAEITRDYYAIDSQTGDVYYFGEDVDVYKSGKVVSHEGSWLSGVNGARFGLMMPGKPRVGLRAYQEVAPGVGMDRFEILSDQETVATPAGKFERCIHIVETSPLEKTLKDHKWYASGIGIVKDAEMVLVKYGMKP